MFIKGKNIIAIPPSATIQELVDYNCLSVTDLALKANLSKEQVTKLLNDDVVLTQDLASRLEKALNVPAKFWLNLENIYREKLNKIKGEKL